MFEILERKVEYCLRLAERRFDRPFKYERVEVNIRGRAAGQIRFDRRSCVGQLPVLRFNPAMLACYGMEFVDEVVPHECAHLVAYSLFGFKIKPHGPQWKSLMRDLYQLEPLVTHRFEVPERKKRRYFPYVCCCDNKVHELTAIRHNRVMRQQAHYLCRACGSKLIQIEKEAVI